MRTEHDSLGTKDVPDDAYWGIHAARAIENFPISGRTIAEYPDLIHAYACVKQAAARANREVGALPADIVELIDRAAEDVKGGALADQFVVDVMQGGAGTSTNMNVNEVIANRALELAGRSRGDYVFLHPLDHVNRGQSTNDTYPTAMKLALGAGARRLLDEQLRLQAAFAAKGVEFADVLKVGRTQLQDAVPMTLGQEFNGFADAVSDDHTSLSMVLPKLDTISLGATAIGTGITADAGYTASVCRHLSEIVGRPLRTAPDLIAATTDMGAYLMLSGVLKTFAMRLSKICNDLRLLSSGPQFGFGEIHLPDRQAGSSIMPGKVNPVIPEVVNQVCFMVAGGDTVVMMASEGGQLQLNAFEPVIANCLLMGLKWMTAAMVTLRENCIDGIRANEARLEEETLEFVGVITAFTPYIGYERAASIVKEALRTGRGIADLVVEHGLMSRTDVETLLAPRRLSGQDTSAPSLSTGESGAPEA